MSESKKPAWNDSRISRRLMLSYGLAGMAGVAGRIWPASAFGDTDIMHGTKTGGRSLMTFPQKTDPPIKLGPDRSFVVYCLTLCMIMFFPPAEVYAAAKGKQLVLSPETTVHCGNFTYTLPPGYVAKKDTAPLASPHMILLNPPFKKSIKDMWESQLFCLEDGIRVEPGISAFRMRQRFDVRSTAKLSDTLEIWESIPLADGKATLHLLGKIIPYVENSVPFITWDNPPYYHPIIPVIEQMNAENGCSHYLVLVEKRMGRWPDRIPPEESKEEKRQRMRKLAEEVYASQKPELKGNTVVVTREDIVNAENVIKKYVYDKYTWDDAVYEICIDSKNTADENIVTFLIYHQDDKKPTSRGAGKSFLVKFDTQKMLILQEIGFQ